MLDFLRACREASLPCRPPGNVVSITGQRLDRYAATTINHRLAVPTGLSAFPEVRATRDLRPFNTCMRHTYATALINPACRCRH